MPTATTTDSPLSDLQPVLATTGPHAGFAHIDFARVAAVHAGADATALPQWLDSQLRAHGALLIRGVPADTPAALEAALDGMLRAEEFLPYEQDRVAPRTQLGSHTYTSSEWHPALNIFLHNECGARLAWPMRILFFCRTPPAGGGQTPIGHVRRITAALPSDLAAEFAERGLRYVRNLNTDGGLPIEFTFGTRDRAAIEAYCTGNAMTIEWLGPERAQLTMQRPAFARHPDTGERLWFNNLGMWSRSNWDATQQRLMRRSANTKLPFHTTFADGGEIPDGHLAVVRTAFDAARVEFDWREGDLLVLDNMLCVHGRNRFEGPREIWTLMARTHARG